MNSSSLRYDVPPVGAPAPIVRMFGWSMLTVLAAFLINNVLIVWYGFPPLASLGTGDDGRVWIVAGIYVLAIVAAGARVLRHRDANLRYEARRISAFNAYLIRGCFYSVLFVGLVDLAVALLRVENALPVLFSEAIARDLIRPQYLALVVHTPLVILAFVVALFSRTLGFHWLALMIVGGELLIVFSRFVFSYEQALMGDLVRYWYAALFLFASAYTLLEDGHVRVDVLYAGFNPRRRGKVNAIGAIFLGMTTSWTILLMGMGSGQAIINAPVKNFEVTQNGTAGMYVKYQMAAFLGVFAVTMLIQFVSTLFESVADARGEPGHRETPEVQH